MIVTTTKIINDVEYEYTYSDAGMMIERDGARYSEAVDPMGSNRQYTETDEPIEPVEELSEIEEKARAYDILMGVRR
jgi:hypothetical protein